MAAFVFWFQRYKISALGVIFMVGCWTTLRGLDQSWQRLDQIRKDHQENRKAQMLWKSYRKALEESSPLIPLFKRHRRIPLWTRAKIREAIIKLVELHGLTLRDYQFVEQSPGNGSSSQGTPNFHRLRLSVGGATDSPIFELIDHLNTHLAPWVKTHKVLLQRCGSVEDGPIEDNEEAEIEEQEGNEDHPLDIVEARLELDWLLTLGDNDNAKKKNKK